MDIAPNRKEMFMFLLLLNVAVYFGLQSWSIVFNNFAYEFASFNGFRMGVTQSVREIPGFLSLLAILAIVVLPEHKLAVVSLAIAGVGIAIAGFMPSFAGVLISTVVISFGFHFYETVNQSLTLQYFDKLESPMIFARLRSVSGAVNVIAGIAVIIMLRFMSYKSIFLTTGILMLVIAIYCAKMRPVDTSLPVQKKSLHLKKKYWLYYVLTFLAGARRQVFVAFSVFLLVEKFKFSVYGIAILFIVNNIINYLFNPLIGKFINKYGERKMLSFEYFVLIFVFTGYAVIENKIAVSALYIIDQIVFNFAIAIRTFYQKIAEPEDFANGSAMGFTINHIAAVFIPLAGGILWSVDRKIPFLCGALLALFSFVFSQFINSEIRKNEK